MADSLLTRLRRRLGYLLLPGMNEFDVAMARNLARFELGRAAERVDGENVTTDGIHEARRLLSEQIQTRPEWDPAQPDDSGDAHE